MATTISHNAKYVTPSLSPGPITEMRWYKTRTGAGLTAVQRSSVDGKVESVTFYVKLFGSVRRLRLLYPDA